MSGYEITFSITAVCPCCGDDLPSSAYLTVPKASKGPLDRDNPYERKDRRVFISPCTKCYSPKRTHGPELMKMLDRHGAGDAEALCEPARVTPGKPLDGGTPDAKTESLAEFFERTAAEREAAIIAHVCGKDAGGSGEATVRDT